MKTKPLPSHRRWPFSGRGTGHLLSSIAYSPARGLAIIAVLVSIWGIAGCASKRAAINPCSLTTFAERQDAVGEPLPDTNTTDNSSGSGAEDTSSVWGAVTNQSCTYKGRTTGIQLRIGVTQFASEEAASKFYKGLEVMSAKSPAITHPDAGSGVTAMQVTGPNNTSTYLLKRDVVVSIELYQPLYKTEIPQKAGLALLPHIVNRLR